MANKTSSAKRTVYYAPGSKLAPRGSQPPLITMGWVLGAASFAVVLALIGVYALLCTLFWQNQWEMLFPLPGAAITRITATPASVGLPFERVTFPGLTGQSGQAQQQSPAQLTGWWIPAASTKPETALKAASAPLAPTAAPTATPTVLYLHGAQQSLSSALPALVALHAAGAQVLAIDYSGYGASRGPHPTEQQAQADTLAAWQYLVSQRGISAPQIIAFGVGAGASFATALDQRHPLGGLILADIGPTARQTFEQDPRARLLPLVLLAREQLNPAPALSTLATPKLFLRWEPIAEKRAKSSQEVNPKSAETGTGNTVLDFERASGPKQLVDLHAASPELAAKTLQGFFAEAAAK